MNNRLKNICQSFSDQAILTWERLEYEKLTNISIGEETLTDINLQDIQIKNPYHIKTKKFNKRQEAKNGADWEWWFCSRNIGFGVRVQAKKLNLETNLYPGIYKKTGDKKQIDILIDEALNSLRPLYPLYVFYNYIDPNINYIPWNSESYPKNIKQLGCSILPAHILKSIFYLKEVGIKDIADIMLPWHDLVCYKSKPSSNKTSLPYKVQRILVKDFVEATRNLDIDHSYLRELNGQTFRVGRIPDYVSKVMKGEKFSEYELESRNVAGVTVINEI